MNRCCRDANNYLKKSDLVNLNELEPFINNFNSKIEEYSTNGLSSFLLGSVELCIKLSLSIGYKRGEAETRWLKGNILSMGGQYNSALKSFYRALGLVEYGSNMYELINSSIALNLFYIGDTLSSLNIVRELSKGNESQSLNYILSLILINRGEDQLSSLLLSKTTELPQLDQLNRVSRLLELNKVDLAISLFSIISRGEDLNNIFLEAYAQSLELLINSKLHNDINIELIPEIVNLLKCKTSSYHYIDGILNIAEVFINLDCLEEGFDLLNRATQDKKDLKSLDLRIFRLMEVLSTKQGDFKKAHENYNLVRNIIKSTNSFEITRALRDMSSFLYVDECIVS